jgi:hypothetical protein
MINIVSNTDSKLIIFLEEFYDYYLFVFTRNNGCEVVKNIYTAIECDFFSFIINEDIAEGVWNLEIYGQDNYSNLNPDNAILVFEDFCRVELNDAYIITEDCNFLSTENNEYLITE